MTSDLSVLWVIDIKLEYVLTYGTICLRLWSASGRTGDPQTSTMAAAAIAIRNKRHQKPPALSIAKEASDWKKF